MTGSGKTLAFLLPILEILTHLEEPLKYNQIGALILSPTRELASQISQVLSKFLEKIPSLKQQLFIGGTKFNEDIEKFKNEGGNIIIGTPGRIEDLLMGKTDTANKNVFVQSVKSLVNKFLLSSYLIVTLYFFILTAQYRNSLPKTLVYTLSI